MVVESKVVDTVDGKWPFRNNLYDQEDVTGCPRAALLYHAGITRTRCASFNLVDLAGSERQSATGATGERYEGVLKVQSQVVLESDRAQPDTRTLPLDRTG